VANYILKYVKAGKALDIGSGEGRDALFLAKSGFDVTAVDISETGINRMLEAAKQLGVGVRGIVQDIGNFEFTEDYDVIVCMSILNFLKDAPRIVEEMKEHTKKGGINVVTVFTEENEFKKFPYMFKKGELNSMYGGWEILDYLEMKDKPHQDKNGGRLHYHVRAFLTARKL
jgi:tellurite methyltransferase